AARRGVPDSFQVLQRHLRSHTGQSASTLGVAPGQPEPAEAHRVAYPAHLDHAALAAGVQGKLVRSRPGDLQAAKDLVWLPVRQDGPGQSWSELDPVGFG